MVIVEVMSSLLVGLVLADEKSLVGAQIPNNVQSRNARCAEG